MTDIAVTVQKMSSLATVSLWPCFSSLCHNVLPCGGRKNEGARRIRQNLLFWWLAPVILPTQEAEIRRIAVRSKTRQRVCETLSGKNPSQKKGWWSSSRFRP
jgi:hypothetical protein